MDKVSIIIPIFNSDKTITRCIQSIINQTYNNIEIILVDDGSTDSSGKICDEFQKIDKRIITIHQRNSGVSSARNIGLDNSSGEYITFVDSDDELLPDFIAHGMSSIGDAELFIGGFLHFNYKGSTLCQMKTGGKYTLRLMNEEYLTDLFKANYIAPCWGKLYSKSLIGDTRFDPFMSFGEDLKFVLSLLEKNPQIIISCNPLYVYIDTEESLTKNSGIDKCLDVVNTYTLLYAFGKMKGYIDSGIYYTYIDNRLMIDFDQIEQLILKDNISINSKYKRLRILYSNNYLISRLSTKYASRFTSCKIRPFKLCIGYIKNKFWR